LVHGVWFVSAALAKDFLSNFVGPHGDPKYLNILVPTHDLFSSLPRVLGLPLPDLQYHADFSLWSQQDVANRKIRAVQIELDDLFHVPAPHLHTIQFPSVCQFCGRKV
jgi:DNA replication licensing factor MCM7